MNGLISEDYLMHHGVKGMKWRVKRGIKNEIEGIKLAGVKYAQSKGVNINVSDVAKVARYKNYMTMAMRYMY